MTDATRTIRVLLADDQNLIREALAALLSFEPDMEVVAQVGRGDDVVPAAAEHDIDVALLDIEMPGMDGLAAADQLHRAQPRVKIVILTTFESDENVFAALRAGASGFLVKDTEPIELLRAVRVVARGDSLLSPSVTRRLIAEFATRPSAERPVPALESLTAREREVMALVAAGLSNDEIAERLVVSPATAKTHVSRAMGKLGARDRAQLVVFAYESGLVSASRAAH